MTRIAQKIIFEGHVQGVGFRYCTKEVAKGFDITGTIRNLPTGNVELIAAGEPDEIREFIQAINESEVAQQIRKIEITTTNEKPEDHKDFRIIT